MTISSPSRRPAFSAGPPFTSPVSLRGEPLPERVLLDAGRYTRLVDAGWRIYRFTKYQVYAEPDEIVATIARALAARST